ncbi:MAG: Maf family protein, partial [Nitrospira sp.]|nr:Maf family protein [Nitrospira sp.]
GLFKEGPALDKTPIEHVQYQALQKALSVASKYSEALLIGADTVVIDEKGILEKPQNPAEACQMLRRLSGKPHQVVTGMAVVATGKDLKYLVRHECTEVTMKGLTEEEIQAYVETGEPLDKAGAYGIQEIGALFIEKINGCYYNVVGLPLALLMKMLREISSR